jgi:two-component system, NarL family, sensor histidine kinase UhpB
LAGLRDQRHPARDRDVGARLTPVTIHAPIAFVEAVLVAVGLLLMLAANLLLLLHTLLPIRRLIERMRTVDLLRPGQRLVVGGGVEAAELVRAFNQMLE